MEKSSELRKGRSCVFAMHVHLVFVTKYRRKVFTKQILDHMQNIFCEICMDFESEIVEFEGEGDHVHLLINYPLKFPCPSLLTASRVYPPDYLRKHGYPSIRKSLWGNQLWSPSYFASSCGGAPIEILRKYIEEQKTPN